MNRPRRFMATLAAAVAVAAGLVVAGPTGTASAAVTPLGVDISWPQCDSQVPTDQAFAIVGVNGSLGNQTNPCLAEQLDWASQSVGGSTQPKTQLYVLFANPGLKASVWPTSNTYQGTTPTNPFGKCATKSGKKQLTLACSYMYGYARAYDDVTIRGAGRPAAYRWWIDVETGLSYQSDTAQNRAAMQGMITGLKAGGVRTIGLYSTVSQFRTIAGTVKSNSPLYGRSNWIAIGKSTVTKARKACSGTPLPGGKIAMVQVEVAYGSGTIDRDVSCS
ncbi:hypothetical protein JOE58_002086 [Curtobacterium luteum]|uniref:Uncharacterized protein n=1 Tax=Curtobacterium luteum TaxID=33881 RepID=A0A8H9GBZ5_9MICO|nr:MULTISPECIES: hypothetical protein [Curtobacterium]MBM7802835.1 hypothetical protein [Curtobacterium luteum]GGL00483.1 hypothetical protein GCM10009769_18380 [Curtobacterium luteum]